MFNISKFKVLFFVVSIIWMCIHQYLLMFFGLSFSVILADNLIFNGLLMLNCFLLINMLNFYRPEKGFFLHLLLVCLLLSLFWVLFSKWLIIKYVSIDSFYLEFLNKTIIIRFFNGVLLISLIGFASQLCYQFEEKNEQLKRNDDAEKLTRDAELFKLRQQLQPHFLFNSLNSISALIGSRPEEARKMIHQLSDFLRGTLKREDIPYVTLTEELEYLSIYLEIEKVRFGHRLETVIEIIGNVGICSIPPMILQPIVENAIKFGLYDTTEKVKITIRAEIIKNDLQVIVENPFDPETSSPQKGTGFGLSAIERRLYLLYYRQDLLQTSTINKVFTTRIIIPQKHD